MEFFCNLIAKKAPAFDVKWFLDNEKNQIRAANFFYSSSFITKFFLFSKTGNFLISIFAAISFYFSHLFFRSLIANFADFGIFGGIHFMVFNPPVLLLILFLFVMLLIDLTLLNTFLVSCPSVSSRIKILYGENFLKQQFYNNSFASAKMAASLSKPLVAGTIGGVVGGAVTNLVGEYLYSINYKHYLEASIQNPELKLNPPKKGLFGFGR